MALPYPEGEVFFKRSVLKDNDGGLNPENLTSFNSYCLVEWCWNDKALGLGYTRNYLNYCEGKYNKNERYYYYNHMSIMFGTKEGFENPVQADDGSFRHYSRHSDIKREIRIELPGRTEEYEKRAKGGPLKTAITPIKLNPNEPYMYIDLIFPIRAIYFPLAQKPSSVFPDLCSYLMVDFRLRQGVRMYGAMPISDSGMLGMDESGSDGLNEWPQTLGLDQASDAADPAWLSPDMAEDVPKPQTELELDQASYAADQAWRSSEKPQTFPMDFDLRAGLGNKPDLMISLYIPGIYNYLILPRQLRSVERGLYMPSDPSKALIRVHSKDDINTTSNFIHATTIDEKLSFKLDFVKILEGHLGVQVVWQPFDIPEPEDANQLLLDVFEAGLCFIPAVGPLASTCFSIFVDIVRNPEAFKDINPFEMGGELLNNVAEAAEQIADGLPKHSKAGKVAKFLSRAGNALTKVDKPK